MPFEQQNTMIPSRNNDNRRNSPDEPAARPDQPRDVKRNDREGASKDGKGPGGGGPGGGPGGSGPGSGMPRPGRGVFYLIALIIGTLMLVALLNLGSASVKELSMEEFKSMYASRAIDPTTVRLTDQGITATMSKSETTNQPATVAVYGKNGTADREFLLQNLQEVAGQNFKIAPDPSLFTQVLMSIIPFILIIVLIWFLLMRGLRSAGGGGGGMLGSFGKSRHRVIMKEKTGVLFSDVAGIEEAKSEVEEIIQFLKNPKKFAKLGGRIPRGVLLIGDPGCGKTLLAKAIAGEADVPFFSISGSDFVEMFVGVGASRVRDLFKQAKENAPCIIFLDEIDAVGRRRGGGYSSGGHDEREQTLNAILVEMDGFATGDGVIIIAATNRADVLDPALTRPGRFDRQIIVSLPDVKGRLEILKVHAKNKKLGPNVDLERMAKATPMFSGADLMAVMNEAAIAATLQDKDFIEQEDLEEARDKVRFGRAKKSRVREADENKLVAYHEAGHAVLQAMLKDADPLHKVTIIPRGGAGGATFSLPEKDRMGYGLKWITATMRVICGGRIAEARAMNDVSSGASQDILQVTSLARTMIEEWGMSAKLGFVRYAGVDQRTNYMPEKSYSDQTARLIDEEVRRMVDEAYADADRMLTENWDKVVAVADALLKYETLDAPEVHKLMRGETLAKPSISDILAAEARKTRDAANPPVLPAPTADPLASNNSSSSNGGDGPMPTPA